MYPQFTPKVHNLYWFFSSINPDLDPTLIMTDPDPTHNKVPDPDPTQSLGSEEIRIRNTAGNNFSPLTKLCEYGYHRYCSAMSFLGPRGLCWDSDQKPSLRQADQLANNLPTPHKRRTGIQRSCMGTRIRDWTGIKHLSPGPRWWWTGWCRSPWGTSSSCPCCTGHFQLFSIRSMPNMRFCYIRSFLYQFYAIYR